jgi:hypothetical protein
MEETPEWIDEVAAFEADRRWMDEHMMELIQHFADYWIAVKNERVIASAADLGELIAHVPDLEHTCVEYISPPSLHAAWDVTQSAHR